MLSILIPSYNADCTNLVRLLYKQATSQNIPFEILLGDDASDSVYRTFNKPLAEQGMCRYFQHEINIGPARLRNYLVAQAQYPFVLFLDTDTTPVSDDFIAKYLQCAEQGAAVCGGFTYKGLSIPDDAILRYKYGSRVEEKDYSVRRRHPYHSFISMNFLIARSCFDRIKFDESFHLGYEDTLFGMHMREANIKVIHINNPVYHRVNETSEKFLIKIERAVANLRGYEDEMRSYVRLLKWHGYVRKMCLQNFISLLYKHTSSLLKLQLKSKYPSLYLFAFYKLGYLCMICEDEKE